MSTTLYDVTVPVMLRGLRNLSHILEKGRAHADANGVAESELTAARLYPDMLPLTGQIQRATDSAKFVPVRVGGVENVPFEDTEVTFADMQARLQRTIAFLEAAPRDAIAAGEDRAVVIKTRAAELTFTGKSYVLEFALPNFFFHVTTAYAILRHKGVPVGKMDFLRGAG
jgi:hypothetical protein